MRNPASDASEQLYFHIIHGASLNPYSTDGWRSAWEHGYAGTVNETLGYGPGNFCWENGSACRQLGLSLVQP